MKNTFCGCSAGLHNGLGESWAYVHCAALIFNSIKFNLGNNVWVLSSCF